jgi:hypothetical protein
MLIINSAEACLQFFLTLMWTPCHSGMARPQVADGEDGFQIWRVAANIL